MKRMQDEWQQNNKRDGKMILQQDIAGTSDYHLCPPITFALFKQGFRSYGEVENSIHWLIASKEHQYFQSGICMLPERWEKRVASDGRYFE